MQRVTTSYFATVLHVICYIYCTSFFCSLQLQKAKTHTHMQARRQRKLEIFKFNNQLQFEITSYIQFYCFFQLVIITNNLQKLRFYQRSSKTMIDNIMFALILRFSLKELYSKFHCSKIFISPDSCEAQKFQFLLSFCADL